MNELKIMNSNHWNFKAPVEALTKTKYSLAKTLQLALLASLLQGCVTTEELYAEYDEQACRVSLVEQSNGTTVVQELVSEKTMTWEPSVLFALGSANLGSEQKRQLDRDIAVLKRYPELRISIRGYTDAASRSKPSRNLASHRSSRVVRYLTEAGINRSRIRAVSVIEGLKPDANFKLPINRRVELVLMDVNGNLVRHEIEETPSVGAAIEE